MLLRMEDCYVLRMEDVIVCSCVEGGLFCLGKGGWSYVEDGGLLCLEKGGWSCVERRD